MLTLNIPDYEWFDDDTQTFRELKATTITLEHSLIAISKWEAKHKKPFLGSRKKEMHTPEELMDYIRCMTVTNNVNPMVYDAIESTPSLLMQIQEYLADDMTATTFAKEAAGPGYNPSRSVITSEIIYYWMVSYGIPFECQKWNIHRLLTLIRVISIKNAPKKKMSKRDVARRNAALNARRKAEMNTLG